MSFLFSAALLAPISSTKAPGRKTYSASMSEEMWSNGLNRSVDWGGQRPVEDEVCLIGPVVGEPWESFCNVDSRHCGNNCVYGELGVNNFSLCGLTKKKLDMSAKLIFRCLA